MSEDGYVHLSASAIEAICLIHVISGLDEDAPPNAPEAAVSTTITGYTEWANRDSPAITIGWDWQLLASSDDIWLQRVGEPRTNLMLQDGRRADVGPARTAVLLEAFIDQLNWQATALHYIYSRYCP